MNARTPRAKQTIAVAVGSLLLSCVAHAHHAMDGATPSTAWQGLLSGLAHPVLGVDHLTVIVALGVMAALHTRGMRVATAFIAASFAGTCFHVRDVTLPGSEWLIAVSVVVVGATLFSVRLVQPLEPNCQPRRYVYAVMAFFCVAGIVHGYAYGESIAGASQTPLLAYLAGLTLAQLAIALGIRGVVKAALLSNPRQLASSLRATGFTICGVGLAILSSLILR